MRLVILFGPPAVGKMTVGYELERLTGLRLFHNHMTVDLALRFFEFGQPQVLRLVAGLRTLVFEEVAASDLPGLIFTYVWALDDPQDKAFIDGATAVFRARGADVCYVELAATQDERLRRNETEFRLAQKPSMRDLEESRRRLLDIDRQYRLSSNGDFFYPDRYLKLDNTGLAPEVAAQQIAAAFGIPTIGPSDPL
jgi:hypothetical protein